MSFSGTVVSTNDDGSFTVDYGPGTIEVEMEDWEWYPKASYLLANDDVVVYGKIDDDFFESRTVDSRSVYVVDLSTQFFTDGGTGKLFPIFTAMDQRGNSLRLIDRHNPCSLVAHDAFVDISWRGTGLRFRSIARSRQNPRAPRSSRTRGRHEDPELSHCDERHPRGASCRSRDTHRKRRKEARGGL